MNYSPPKYQAAIGAMSLVVGPTLMSVRDLIHPAETWDSAAQVAIIAGTTTRWFTAHLLLFIGILLFVPGLLALTGKAIDRKPGAGYTARVLLLISLGALSAVFVGEMLLGGFIAAGADQAAAISLLQIFMSKVLMALMPGMLAFFVGTGIAVWIFASTGRPYRWPAWTFGLGAVLILAEIISAKVLLSQIGNILVLVAGIGFARLLLRDQQESVHAG